MQIHFRTVYDCIVCRISCTINPNFRIIYIDFDKVFKLYYTGLCSLLALVQVLLSNGTTWLYNRSRTKNIIHKFAWCEMKPFPYPRCTELNWTGVYFAPLVWKRVLCLEDSTAAMKFFTTETTTNAVNINKIYVFNLLLKFLSWVLLLMNKLRRVKGKINWCSKLNHILTRLLSTYKKYPA